MDSSTPFAKLGNQLRIQRERRQESLSDVAGAVEVDEAHLYAIEQGIERPSEDLLMLMFNHFNTADDEALNLWELAGYSRDMLDDDTSEQGPAQQHLHKVMMTVALDPRTLYSDSAQVVGNKHGIVINFMQPATENLQPLPIARVGMSREQAKALHVLLGDTLDQLTKDDSPKQIPPSSS